MCSCTILTPYSTQIWVHDAICSCGTVCRRWHWNARRTLPLTATAEGELKLFTSTWHHMVPSSATMPVLHIKGMDRAHGCLRLQWLCHVQEDAERADLCMQPIWSRWISMHMALPLQICVLHAGKILSTATSVRLTCSVSSRTGNPVHLIHLYFMLFKVNACLY